MPRPRLALASTLEVATCCDGESDQNHLKDGREPCGETCPVQVDQGGAVVGLVEGYVGGGISDFGVENDLSIVLGVNGGGLSNVPDGFAVLSDVLFNKLLLMDFINETLSVADEKGRHC